MLWQGILLIVYCVVMPWLALWLASRFKWAEFLGPVLMCCAFGIVVANQPIFALSEEVARALMDAGQLISKATIPLAIPLLLFQSDLSNLREHGKTSMISFIIAVVSVASGIAMMTVLYGDQIEEAGKVAGMLMSVYIGGTPNLVAVQTAVQASEQSFGLVYAAATFVSSFYLIFLLTVARPLLGRFFPAHPDPAPFHGPGEATEGGDEEAPRATAAQKLKSGALSLLASAACVAISAGVTIALTGEPGSLGVILGITTLSIIGSFSPRLRSIPTHEPIGTYLILVFCVSAGTMMDVEKLVSTGSIVLTYTAWSVVVFLLIHYIASRLFRVDIDTTITMSVATMYGPPFIPAVVQALGNRRVLLPGMTMGFLGYAVGTYLGIAVGTWW